MSVHCHQRIPFEIDITKKDFMMFNLFKMNILLPHCLND